MRFSDFQIYREARFADRREINPLTRQVEEEFRYELGARPRIEAPFGKLVIPLYDLAEDLPEPRLQQLLDVMFVPMRVRFDLLQGDARARNAVLLDTLEAALRLLAAELGWSDGALFEIVQALRGRERLGWIELLEKRDRRTGQIFKVVYDVGEHSSAVHVIVSDAEEREIRRERVAFHQPMNPLELFFPVRSAVVREGRLILRDASRQVLASVPATATADE